MFAQARLLVIICCVGALGACNSIPRDALDSYVSAFDQARSAGEALTNDFAAAQAESERRDAARNPPAPPPPQPEIPLVYTPPSNGSGPLTATAVRLLAWETIGEYNAALAALSAGESVEKIKNATGRLGTAATKIATAAGQSLPGAGPIIAAAQEIAAIVEQARLSGEFRKAIGGGVSTVRDMLAVMLADTSAHYQLRAALASEDLIDLASDERVKRARIKAAIAELKKSLDQFVVLVGKCDESLVALQKATDKPMDFVSHANGIFAVARSMKTHWTAYQAARVEGAQ